MTIEVKIEINDQTLQKILDNTKEGIDVAPIAEAVAANIQLKVKAEALKLFLDILKSQGTNLSEFLHEKS